jgi:hypothetical protein
MTRKLPATAANRLAIALIAAVLAACAGAGAGLGTPTPTPTDRPSPSPVATPTPTPTATPSPSAPPSPTVAPTAGPGDANDPPAIEQGTLVEVTINGLNVRERAGLAFPVITFQYGDYNALQTLTHQLNEGDHAIVLDGPVEADGHSWYQLATGQPLLPPRTVFIGWAAAGNAADPWLQADSSWCPSDPGVPDLIGLTNLERLGCYGSETLTFDAAGVRYPQSAGLGGACPTDPAAPRWLICDNVNYNYVTPPGGDDSQTFLLHFDPTGTQPWVDPLTVQGVPMRITGHFDDPAAADCAIGFDDAAAAVVPITECRTLFVVDSLVVTQ